MPLVDSHLHLHDRRFDADRDRVLARARAAGLGRMLCCGTSADDWQAVLDLAQAHADVLPALGLHPWYADTAAGGWQQRLATLARDHEVVALGEIGLDRHFVDRGYDLQERVFEDQLDLAADLRLPVSVHCVKAWDRLVPLLKTHAGRTAVVIHAFNSSAQVMARLLDLGAMLSFATTAAQPRNHRLRECLRQAPADRLLLESDAPDMFSAALVPADDHEAGRNGRNEPACVAGLYALAADLRDVDIDQLQERLWQNAAIFTTRTSDRR